MIGKGRLVTKSSLEVTNLQQILRLDLDSLRQLLGLVGGNFSSEVFVLTTKI